MSDVCTITLHCSCKYVFLTFAVKSGLSLEVGRLTDNIDTSVFACSMLRRLKTVIVLVEMMELHVSGHPMIFMFLTL